MSWGLKVGRHLGVTAADILSDCQVLVSAMSSSTLPHWKLWSLFGSVMRLYSSYDVVSFWIPRESNEAAHLLAKWGLSHDCNCYLNFWERSTVGGE
ncbi:hypothetical protein G4B88_002138 [Cannabis sativa]|uniref:RNase H type-1 domain-containing protein n=1 Tax=Cannabis sativa TaxID=3483 RepID=A0A7J6EY75_CANSA|nr:hypothetical protein G4B88_002138 [Cannabis sativa]